VRALLVACVVMSALPAVAGAEQAAEPASPAAGRLDAGGLHSCAVLVAGSVRCWGYGASGQLGYGTKDTIGDDETPASVSPVSFGAGRTATAITAGDYHTCALLDDGSVRCWGYGGDGRLGYANTNDVLSPRSAGPVDLGPGRTATAISAGGAHTCALLDDGSVRCWGYGGDGRLGYGNHESIGDNETPGSVGPVDLGAGRSAKAISAGGAHTCAVLDDGSVRCWGIGSSGRLGYGNQTNIGYNETPGSVGPVSLGPGRTAKAISAGDSHTCSLLDDGSLRCWGEGGHGQLGYGSAANAGDTPATTPDKVGAVDLGPGRTAVAITAGGLHTCALLDDGTVRCWGFGGLGQLGYANIENLGDTPATTPSKLGPVDLGAGRTALAISAGARHTCARLDNGSVRCWGYGAYGRLGYCNQDNVGQTDTPGSVGPVNLEAGDGGAGCRPASRAPAAGSEAVRARGLHRCLATVTSRARRERELARRGSARQRARARRHLTRLISSGRRRCLRLFGRTPGRVTEPLARAVSHTQIELDFTAPGTDASQPPAAHSYLIKQSSRPIRSPRDFARAKALCRGRCHFAIRRVGGRVSLTVTNLRPHTTYYYAISARDNVSGRPGPRSHTVKQTT